ncbi:hypothetical protein D3C72_2005680 [compost metagenome]
MDERANGRATRLAQQQGRLGIDVDKHFFDGRAIGLVGADDFAHAPQDDLQARRQFPFGTRLDGPRRDIAQLVAVFFNDPKAGRAQARIDAKNNHRQIL